MKRLAMILGIGVACGWGSATLAHEGHQHPATKVMGTVVQVHTAADVSHIEVKTSHGEKTTLTAAATTRYLKGKAPAALSDVKAGVRIVATVTKDGQLINVSEVQIGSMDAAVHDEKAGDHHDH